MISPYATRAKTRARIQAARRNAPKHPPGPEANLRRIVTTLLSRYQSELQDQVLQKLDFDPAFGERLLAWGRGYLAREDVRAQIEAVVRKVAASVISQVEDATDQDVQTALDDQVSRMVEAILGILSERLARMNERAQEIADRWDEREEALDEETAKQDLEDGLGGVVGGGLASLAMLYGYSWADMNESVQASAGVESYVWVAQRDGVTRPAHLNLDNALVKWDGDPPLSADESSSGEPCHAGEDFNCRCVAAPFQ